MELIKKTKSLCPECLKEIEASVFEKGGGVWMQKKCNEHGEFWGFVEKDIEFYKAMMNEKGETCPEESVLVPITHKCNLNCNFCFVPNRRLKDKSTEEVKEEIKKIISKKIPLSICLSGGEPTLRDDLFLIIEFIKKDYPFLYVVLLTNGIKLADLNFVKKLKEAGLDAIIFSLNSFNDDIYQKINNAKLSEIKIKALENIKKAKIMTALSPTLISGENEKDLKDIIDFALDNLDFINEIRIRGAAKVGRHSDVESLTVSEMLKLTEDSLGVERNFFLKNFSRKECYHSAYSFNILLFIRRRKNEKNILGWYYGDKYKKSTKAGFIKKGIILIDILLRSRVKDIISAIFKSEILIPRRHKHLKNRDIFRFLKMLNVYVLRINIWYWADKNNIDLNEIKAWGMKHATADGRIFDFSEATIRAEEL